MSKEEPKDSLDLVARDFTKTGLNGWNPTKSEVRRRVGGLIAQAEKRGVASERKRIRKIVEELNERNTLNKDEVHCSCWPHAFDVLEYELSNERKI